MVCHIRRMALHWSALFRAPTVGVIGGGRISRHAGVIGAGRSQAFRFIAHHRRQQGHRIRLLSGEQVPIGISKINR